ncbi:MAG TPA: metal-binding protein, partial [Pirellulales bacterium]|nr:metal-binding protein [Pirellulales bacterium]
MKMTLAYLGRSRMVETSARNGRMLSMAPNLTREKVSFDAPLLHPLRFREAISTLHDVVISDLRFKPRDKTAYESWKKEREAQKQSIYRREYERGKKELETRREQEIPPGFEKLFEKTRKHYWDARFKLARLLQRDDPELWRWLMPCDPVITVADDVVFFECFSADESSYGCLTVSREGFGPDASANLGTTNVDYSWDLYNQFQLLRSYRKTQFLIDPAGFEVKTEAAPDYREEKIDLPAGWLRGFMTTQEAMGMPSQRVPLSREAVYSAIAFLKRHKAKTSPRAVRFELLPGNSPAIVLEPWEQRIISHGTKYDGPATEPIRIWGARRLLVLARLLPLAERFDVQLLGTGLPSFWVAHMGEMKLTLGLSGWTTNDWTRGSALELLSPPATITEDLLAQVARLLATNRSMSLTQLQSATRAQAPALIASLRRLAFAGQVIHDLPHGV